MSDQKDAFPQGGNLSDMAATGTSVPEDSAKPRIIPSKAKPGQVTDTAADANDLGASDLASAADNASDMPRVSTQSYHLCDEGFSSQIYSCFGVANLVS